MPTAPRSRLFTRAVVTLGVTSACVAAGLTTGGPVAAAAPTAGGTAPEAVIVVLHDQISSQPADAGHVGARRNAATGAQNAVLGRLAGAKAKNVKHYAVGNAFAATISADQAAALARDPAVASVVPDTTVKIAPPTADQAASAGGAQPNSGPPGSALVNPAACSTDPANPVLEPEALQTINARSSDPNAKTAAALGFDGSGVKVAFIADGINPANAGLKRTDGSSAVVDYQDFYGDGPDAVTSGAEAFGDASAIAAQGNVVYDVAKYSNPAVVKYHGNHCYIKIVGVAPGAEVVALKAGSELLPNSAILQAIDYAVTVAHVNVINESFGANLTPDSGARNTIQLFNDQAVAAGVTVTASTGDAGISSTIGSPATDPLIISTGASTDSRLYEQTGYALATKFSTNGGWLDDNISALSSAGITQAGRTIDLSAPGEADWAICDSGGRFVGCVSWQGTYSDIQAFGGTSQSAPITAGAAALVIQAYRSTHGASTPTPAVVKQILVSTARDLGQPGQDQGAGRLDARAAVEAALTWTGATAAPPAGTGQNIALSAGQLHVEGAPGSSQTATVSVTNVGTVPQQIATTSRTYVPISTSHQDLSIAAATDPTTPYPTTGLPWAYRTTTFTVPPGTDELKSTIRWQSGAQISRGGPVVRLSIFAPDGSYAGNTRPQGAANPSNYGLITESHPAAGTWTAVIYTAQTGPLAYTGAVTLDNLALRATTVGTLTPALTTLAPGGSTTVSYTVAVPASGGDTVDTISIGSSGGHQVAIPVVARAIVPNNGSGTFAGTITGGNARGGAPAQTFSYAFDVPAGKKDLDVSVTLAKDPTTLLEGIVVDPHGEAQSINTNQLPNSSGQVVREAVMRNTVAAPMAGRWRYVVVVVSPVSGQFLTQDFAGQLQFDQVPVTAPTLPSSLKQGVATQIAVTVTNTGARRMLVQTDARLAGLVSTRLATQFGSATIQLPLDVNNLASIPEYLVPPDTQALGVTASSTVPAQLELSSPTGGIDLFGDLQSAKDGSTISTATAGESTPTVGLGFWSTYVQEIGPFTDAGAPAATSVLSNNAITAPLDRQVTTSTGDPFAVSFDPTAGTGRPVVIAAGATATILVTITPTAAVGSTVTGVLHLVTPPFGVARTFNTTGEVLANIPYSYQVS